MQKLDFINKQHNMYNINFCTNTNNFAVNISGQTSTSLNDAKQ